MFWYTEEDSRSISCPQFQRPIAEKNFTPYVEVFFERSKPLDFCRNFRDPLVFLFIFKRPPGFFCLFVRYPLGLLPFFNRPPLDFYRNFKSPLDFLSFLKGTPLDGKSDLLNIGGKISFWDSPIRVEVEAFSIKWGFYWFFVHHWQEWKTFEVFIAICHLLAFLASILAD